MRSALEWTGSPHRLAGLVAVNFVVLLGCSGDSPDSSPQDRALVALLANGQLVKGTTARLGEGLRLTRRPLRAMSGRLIALTPDRRLLAVLLAAPRSRRSEVVVLTAHGLHVRARIQLPFDRKARASALVAPAPDRLVVLGERKTRAGNRLPIGWVIAVPSGHLIKRWTFPREERRTAPVIDAAAARDRERLYLSYHGGVDVISWKSGRSLCRGRWRGADTCIAEIHGEVAAVPDGVVGTGADDQTLLRASPASRIIERWPTRLAGNHLMRFAYDPTEDRAFALGSCLYAGGLARIDLDGGWRWRRGTASGGRPSMCGERMTASGGLVAFTEGPEWAGGHESEITVVDAETGSVRARLPIEVPAVDLILLR